MYLDSYDTLRPAISAPIQLISAEPNISGKLKDIIVKRG